MNKLIGIIGTTLGGGMVGAGIQRTYLVGNRISSGISKLLGNGSAKFDSTTWMLLVIGVFVLIVGIYYTMKKR
jgi:hypothetical protein